VPRARLAARTSHVTYKCDQPLTTRAAQSKYLVGVFNKGTGELTLHPVDTILALNQSIAVSEFSEDGAPASVDVVAMYGCGG
jgi:anti-sigma-K factor RskA